MKLPLFFVGTFATFALAVPVTVSTPGSRSYGALATRNAQADGTGGGPADEMAMLMKRNQSTEDTAGRLKASEVGKAPEGEQNVQDQLNQDSERGQGGETSGQCNNDNNGNEGNGNGENRDENNNNRQNRNGENRKGENNKNKNENENQRGFDPSRFNRLVFNKPGSQLPPQAQRTEHQTLALSNRFNVGGFQTLFTNNAFAVNSLLQLQQLNTLVSVADAGFFNGRDLSNVSFHGLQLGALGNIGRMGLTSFVDASQLGVISPVSIAPIIVA
ncbi:hypothetical protein HIM_01424 [Hirsutella minnesotensis 3608]|nr:hypothetical protein HIM_01424 [Hirsutella minnesotensis 3608]